MKSYGITKINNIVDKIDFHIENIRIKGFSIEECVFTDEDCTLFSNKLEDIYSKQEMDFSKEKLEEINEVDIARMPFTYDNSFSKLFMHPLILELTSKIIGNTYHLHLQNGIINRPKKEHHQLSWHRDLPYQDWTISKPLAFNAFVCLSDFNSQNGATFVLPFSHNLDFFPSDKYVKENEIQINAKKGSVIFFNSMIYHRAGSNFSDQIRYGLNNMFVVPILKQQIVFSNCIEKDKFSEEELKIIGCRFDAPLSVYEFRLKKVLKYNHGKD